MERTNIAIFVSGSGTNCENRIKYFANHEHIHPALVVSNKPDAYALERAERLGVPTAVTPKALMQAFGFCARCVHNSKLLLLSPV